MRRKWILILLFVIFPEGSDAQKVPDCTQEKGHQKGDVVVCNGGNQPSPDMLMTMPVGEGRALVRTHAINQSATDLALRLADPTKTDSSYLRRLLELREEIRDACAKANCEPQKPQLNPRQRKLRRIDDRYRRLIDLEVIAERSVVARDSILNKHGVDGEYSCLVGEMKYLVEDLCKRDHCSEK